LRRWADVAKNGGSGSIPEGFRKESQKSRKTCKNTMFRKFLGRLPGEMLEESGNELLSMVVVSVLTVSRFTALPFYYVAALEFYSFAILAVLRIYVLQF